MSALRQALELRRDGENGDAHPCFSANAGAAALLVEVDADTRWVLPWSHFLHGYHDRRSAPEILRLAFARHEVILRGHNLTDLAVEAAQLRLERIRALPAGYREVETAEPFIQAIEVRGADAPQEDAAPPAPSQISPASRNEKYPTPSGSPCLSPMIT